MDEQEAGDIRGDTARLCTTLDSGANCKVTLNKAHLQNARVFVKSHYSAHVLHYYKKSTI